MAIENRKHLVRITTSDGETFIYRPIRFAEDEDDYAYDFVKYSDDGLLEELGQVVLEADFMEKIEELTVLSGRKPTVSTVG